MACRKRLGLYHIVRRSISSLKGRSVVVDYQRVGVDAVRALVLCSTSRVDGGGECRSKGIYTTKISRLKFGGLLLEEDTARTTAR